MRSVDAILTAAKHGDYDRVVALLDDDPALVIASSMPGAQPIHAAHFGAHRRIVEFLVSRGVEIDSFLACDLGMIERIDPKVALAFSPAESTGLHRACYWGQTAVARLLLDHGADPNAVTRDSFLQTAPLGVRSPRRMFRIRAMTRTWYWNWSIC